MFTVTQLANRFGISRTTLLYYEREGLLSPSFRANNGYRQYGENEVARLESILSYRSFGVPVQEIAALLNHQNEKVREHILRDQFTLLDLEIQRLRKQQSAIVALLQDPTLLNEELMTKERWSQVMRNSGLNDQDMDNWHKQFEKMEPEGHQKFLESLGIENEEIQRIRQFSKQ